MTIRLHAVTFCHSTLTRPEGILNRRQNISWNDILDLRIIQSISSLINRHWNLGIGYVTAQGYLLKEIKAERFSTKRPLCALLRSCDETGKRCAEAGLTISRSAYEHWQKYPNLPTIRAFVHVCHAGLREVVAPIFVDGSCLGYILAGGFLPQDTTEDANLLNNWRLLPGIEETEWLTAIESMPRLDERDVSYLCELLELLANEVTVYQTEIGGIERRTPQAEQERPLKYNYGKIIGLSRPMRQLFHQLDKVVESDSTVLIQGENGTGKELVAKAIHFNSARRDRPFVVQNCSAFNDNLLDSELFGHRRGSFTGAISDKMGLFESADGGTFFLDEIGDMTPALQVKVLRVLQEGTFVPVGDTNTRHVDVRIIAATHRDLATLMARGQFREDLFYRINVLNLYVPPLRERKEDIPHLVDFYLRKHAAGDLAKQKKINSKCLDQLQQYNWPGNVRELQHEIERLVVLSGDEKIIDADLLSPRIREPQSFPQIGRVDEEHNLPQAKNELEKQMILEVLKRHHWNKTHAAEELRISRRNLIRKVNKYGLDQRKNS